MFINEILSSVPAESCQADSCTGANEVCNDDNAKIACDCDDDFQKLDGACVANTCTNFPGICGAEEECVSAVCVAQCGTGYSRNAAGDCEDINECLNSPCAENQVRLIFNFFSFPSFLSPSSLRFNLGLV